MTAYMRTRRPFVKLQPRILSTSVSLLVDGQLPSIGTRVTVYVMV